MKQQWTTWLWNPFMYIAGWKALCAGVLMLVVTAVLASFSGIRFDGVLDIHVGPPLALVSQIEYIGIDYLLLTVLLCISGMLLSKSQYRIIDIAGTQLLARWPFVWVAVLALLVDLGPLRAAATQLKPEEIASLFTAPFILFLIVSVCTTIWMIMLMYRSYTISFNVSGTKAVVSFIVCLLASEIFSKMIILTYIQ